jgi:hypothetical protein
MSKVKTTNRGFEILNFRDHNGIKCSLQQSSAIDFQSGGSLDHPGSSLIWLGCDNADPKYFVPNGNPAWRPVEMPEEYVANTRMHLNREGVEMLITHLQNWLKTGAL